MDEHVFRAIVKIFKVLEEKQSIAELSDRELIYVQTKLESIIDQYGAVDPEPVDGVVGGIKGLFRGKG